MSRKTFLESKFPNLVSSGYKITSDPDKGYNCIAWAAKDNEVWWWPDPQYTSYWPQEVPREETREAFIAAYSMIGYNICDNPAYEDGFEKIAIYLTPDGKPQHAARQVSSERWTSKLGEEEDIEHNNLDGVEGRVYGHATIFMKRTRPS